MSVKIVKNSVCVILLLILTGLLIGCGASDSDVTTSVHSETEARVSVSDVDDSNGDVEIFMTGDIINTEIEKYVETLEDEDATEISGFENDVLIPNEEALVPAESTDYSDDELVQLAVHILSYDNPTLWWHRGWLIDVGESAEGIHGNASGRFRPVGRFNSIAEMQAATEQMVTRRFAEERLYYAFDWNDTRFVEFDGRLYFNMPLGAAEWTPMNILYGTVVFRNEDKAVLEITYDWPLLVLPGVEYRHEVHLVRLVKEDNLWKIDIWPEEMFSNHQIRRVTISEDAVNTEIEEYNRVLALTESIDYLDEELLQNTLHFLFYGDPVLWWLRGWRIDVDESVEPIKSNEFEYFQPVGRFNSVAEMQATTERIVTRRFAEEHLYHVLDWDNSRLFAEFDGRLYINTFGGGGWRWEEATYGRIISISEYEAMLEVIYKWPLWVPIYIDTRYSVYHVRLVKENGLWKIDTWPGRAFDNLPIKKFM